MSVKRICEAIVRNEKSILPVSHLIKGLYGIDDVVLSLPAIVGKEGLEDNLPLTLSGEEALKLKESAEALKKVLGGLRIEKA